MHGRTGRDRPSANVFSFSGGDLQNRLAVRHLRPAHVGLHAELAHHPVHDNFQVQLAHSRNQRLPRIVIGMNAECGIFLRELAQRRAHFFLIGFSLGFDRHGNNGSGKVDVFEDDRLLFITKRVAGRRILQSDASGDVARFNRLDFFALIRVHSQQTSHALARFSRRVVNKLPRLQARPSKHGCKSNGRRMGRS